MKREWKVGDKWRTMHGHVFIVESIQSDGIARVKMIKPYVAIPVTQKDIPDSWVRITPKRNPVERFQWKRPEAILRFPKLITPDWDHIIPLLIVLPGFRHPEIGFYIDEIKFWFQYGNPHPVHPTHWQQLPGLPKHP